MAEGPQNIQILPQITDSPKGDTLHTYNGKENKSPLVVNDNEATHLTQCQWGHEGTPAPSAMRVLA